MKSLTVIIWLIPFQICTGQSLSVTSDEDGRTIYNSVFELYLKKEVPILTEDSILVEYNYLTTQYLPPVINGVRVKQVEINKKLFKKHKVVKFFRIVPLRYTNTVFNITIIEFEARFEKNKNNIAMVNKNGEKFEFVYDCTKRQLVSMF